MRILLVTLSGLLPAALGNVLNPKNEYCAIVVDEPEPARELFNKVGLPESLIHPLYELKECIEDFHYDCLFCISSREIVWEIHKKFKKYNLPQNKFVHYCLTDGINNGFIFERVLRYYKEHAADFDMFATGISYIAVGLDATQFTRKLFNFGRSSQDLYYDYQIAKFVLSKTGGGRGKIRYALIGLAPYSFHYDQSKSYSLAWRLPHYFIAMNDLHNFWMSEDKYRGLFSQEYLSFKIPLENFDPNNANLEKSPFHLISLQHRVDARDRIDVWKDKSFPETCKENIKILDDYLTLCEKNKVMAVMFLPPMTEGYVKHFSRQKLDEFHYLIREARKKHSTAVFFDGWKLEGFSDKDFYDVDHLNIQGAAKFSAIFNNVIEQLENQQK